MKIHIGCSGFSYRDWKGTFYPSNIDSRDMIVYYEKYFDILEINYTFYSMPHRYTMKGFLEKTKRLKFSVKVNRKFTHDRDYTSKDVRNFLQAIEPLMEGGRFLCLLFQFPQSFHYSQENLEYLRKLSEDFSGVDRALEVRSRSFNRHEFFIECELMGFSLVNVDGPKVKGLLLGPWKSCGSFNYVRLHGRNEKKWFDHKEAYERYDYLYSLDELEILKRKIEEIYEGKETYVFFNNHYRGKGALNALQMKELFGEDVKIPKGLLATFSTRLWE